MSKKIFIVAFLMLLLPFTAAASKAIGPEVSEYRGTPLKWEDGAYGYHVMFKSLLEMKNPSSNRCNPQGDSCKDSSTYTLQLNHIPADAIIEDAYLIWTGALAVQKKDDPTDNTVNLSFVSEDGRISENREISGKKAYKISEAGNVSFEFDAFKDVEDPNKRWFTYRVNVLDFFKSIQEKGRANSVEGAAFYDGYSLLGNYTLSGLDCTDDAVYKGSTEMVSDWSIILIYSSATISPKKIYIYDGFKSYWHELSEINVTGFEFPIDPQIRLTLATHEGDPGLVTLYPESGMLYPEGIQVQGDAPDWLTISNTCNPEAWKSDGVTQLTYAEIFNSISSVYGYEEENPTCIGGIPSEDCNALDTTTMEFGMDVDTFVMDSYTEGKYAAHFHKGGQQIKLRVGANQDSVITNYMIVSVDTKAPQFDIPGQPEKVACTPASDSFDPASLEGKWCQNLEHTFALRIQNWGSDYTGAVTVKDSIPAGMEYVPGSTEYATSFKVENGKKIATRWIPIPDAGGFPLENGVKIADSLNFCPDGSDYLACDDLIMVRFRAKVSGSTPKNQIIENTAIFATPGVNDYKTNLGIPVKLRMLSSGCKTSQDDVDLSDCGGVGAAACTKNEDCGEGYICNKDDGSCIDDPSFVQCNNAVISANLGKNTPPETMIIKNPQTDLVIGQLALTNEEKCYFNLAKVSLKIDVDSSITLSNFKMYRDNNGNGIVDSSDTLLATSDAISSGYLSFSPSANRMNNIKSNILFTLDAEVAEGTSISNSTTFSSSIEEGGIVVKDGGTPVVKDLPIKFTKFQFEPDKGFIITKGPHDPEVPAKSQMNSFHDVLQLRLLAKGADEILKRITVHVPKSQYANFGSAIKKLVVYEDTDNDGKGDKELMSTTSFDSTQNHKFNLNLEVPENTEKFLTIAAELSLSENETFQIQISAANTDKLDVYGVPVNSKPYTYSCEPGDEDCGDNGGCSIVASEENSSKALYAAILTALALLSAFAFRMRKN